MNQNSWNICVPNASAVTRFAAEEFGRLIRKMDPKAEATISNCAFSPEVKALWIGLDAGLPKAAQVEDPLVDDGICMDVQNGVGYITGTNERSVLIGVYRFFREAGCMFVRPGREGEYIPKQNSMALRICISETAAYRHRGICLEGSNSYENVVDMIDFAPKLGFNAYFTQLFRPAFTFDRWYSHSGNSEILPAPISNATIDAFVEAYSEQIALRGLHHHRIGHGWATKILGITSGAWHEQNEEAEVNPERRNLIAYINGQRKLFKGSGIDTNLCYSDPEVQSLLAEEIVKYAKANPDTRYLHFWLADQLNNQCECETCQKRRPSDFYVDMLNKMDARLTEEGLDTKIVFLIYLDLLWEPETARIHNQDRFVMMFAPIRRSYSVPMASDTGRKQIPYRRNGFRNPQEAGGALPYLKAWQEQFHGDSFIFDYHYMWDYVNDPGTLRSVQIMAKDVEDFRKLGLNGFMSCQNQRVFMPNGLGMHMIGNTLWTGKDNFREQAAEYYAAAYGADGQSCMTFLETLSDLFDPVVLRGESKVRTPENMQQYEKIPSVIDAFLPVIARNLETCSDAQHRSWECLSFYGELCRKLSQVLLAAARDNRDEMEARWLEVREYVCSNELRFQKEFDVFEFLLIWESKTLPRFRKQAELQFE